MPGTDAYIIGSPNFDRATLTLAPNRQFIIDSRDNGPQRGYIRAAKLNGQPFNRVFLTHSQMTAGGQLVLDPDRAPNFLWAIGEGDRPPAPLNSVISQ